jgi:heme/copper-type cytochrome/quinol oxidase subunit 3
VRETPLLQDKVRLAVVLFIASEAVFFLFLLVAYIYSHPSEIAGPTAANSLEPWKTAIYTVFLLASSLTLYCAERSLEGKRRHLFAWLGVTILFGAVFLFGEVREYSRLLHLNISIGRNLFGSTYYTLTGFHALHVMLGLLMLLTLLGLLFVKKLGRHRHIAFTAVSYYWHFVDAVWIAVFSVVYLWSAR